jgi:hypothetical protein
MKKKTLSLILISLFIGFAFSQPTRAVNPPPDGGYAGFNTAEGQDALFSLAPKAAANTAIVFMRSTPTRPATATLLLALMHWLVTRLVAAIPQPVFMH